MSARDKKERREGNRTCCIYGYRFSIPYGQTLYAVQFVAFTFGTAYWNCIDGISDALQYVAQVGAGRFDGLRGSKYAYEEGLAAA